MRRQEKSGKTKKAIALMILCTLFLTAGQFLFKRATTSFGASLAGTILNLPLVLGLVVSGIASILLTYALKHAQLSIVYPFIALSFVWTAFVAVLLLGETLALQTVAGVLIIVAGVAVLAGAGGRA